MSATQFAYQAYREKLNTALDNLPQAALSALAETLLAAWQQGRCIYICGNGGSAANALHIANDLIYGAARKSKRGMKVEALSANQSVLTCLANDIGYDNIYAYQLRCKAETGDILLVLSGSGNSPNVIKALEAAREMSVQSFAILGYDGGRCKELADTALHIPINDMQIAEDLQLIICHICMQWLCEKAV